MSFQKIWNEYYKGVHSISYYFDAKEGKNINLLVKKIKFFYKEDQQIELSEEQLPKALKYFLDNIEDDYTLENLNPSTVNNRFNILNARLNSKRIKEDTSHIMKSSMKPTKE